MPPHDALPDPEPSPHLPFSEGERGEGLSDDLLPERIERLLVSRSSGERDTILLEAALELGAARSVALWRAGSLDEPLREVLARGPRDLLPSAEQVEAVQRGALGPELPLQRVVLVSEDVHGGAALALGGAGVEDAVDRLGALFSMWACVVMADEEEPVVESAPLPENAPRPPRSDGSAELRSLLDAVANERAEYRRRGLTLAVRTDDDLVRLPPSLGERRLFHVVRSLLAEARLTAAQGAHLELACTVAESGADEGWQLSGKLEQSGTSAAVFRMWLPAGLPAA